MTTATEPAGRGLAGIYTRVSLEDGEASSTPRQERLCRAWAEEERWKVADVYEDISVSAYQPGLERPQFERLLADISARRLDVIVVSRLDRLVRSPADYERVLATCQHAGVLIRSVTEPVDSVDPMGIAVGRLFALFAGLESDARSARLRSKNLERAQAGKPPPAGVFGLSADCTEIIEHEAAMIREATDRVLGGEAIRHIALDFEQRGLTRRDGKPFRYDGLRKVLTNPAVCGDRLHRGEVVAEGCWPAILDRETAATVRNVLATGRRHAYRKPIRSLLAGMVTCGRCGGPMNLGTATKAANRYRCCHPLQCNRLSITQEHLERWVTEQVLRRLRMRRPRGNRKPWDQRDANEMIRALNRESDALHQINRSHFINAEITYTEWVRMRDALALTTAQAVARNGPPHPRGLDPTIPIWRAEQVWDTLSLQTRHDVLAVELHQVVIHPPIGRMWHPDRAVPVWILPDPKRWAPTPGPRYPVSNQYGTWHRHADRDPR